MFISRKTYDELNARHVEISRKVKELEDENKAISDSRYSLIAENIIYKNKEEQILKLIESNSYGRTAEQRLQKIKEVIISDQTN